MTDRKVRLSEAGRMKYPDTKHNPHAGIGIDEGPKAPDPRWTHWVTWENGEINEYREGELEVIE